MRVQFSARSSRPWQSVVTASDDGTARVWNVATGKEMAVFRGHEGRVSSAQFSRMAADCHGE